MGFPNSWQETIPVSNLIFLIISSLLISFILTLFVIKPLCKSEKLIINIFF